MINFAKNAIFGNVLAKSWNEILIKHIKLNQWNDGWGITLFPQTFDIFLVFQGFDFEIVPETF